MNDRRKAFIHTGSDLEKEPFHYTQCGLDDVYLLNGFTLRQTSYGEAFSVKNIDGLHHAIARKLICERKDLNGKEVRFIRKHLSLTQEELGSIIAVSAQQVARYEKDESPIQSAPLWLLRTHFLMNYLPDDEAVGEFKKTLAGIKTKLGHLKEMIQKSSGIYLRAGNDSEWSAVAQAA